MVATVRCEAELVGIHGCHCGACLAIQAADAEAEWLAEVGANYAYSGHSAHDAMTMARNDREAVRVRFVIAEQRQEFRRLRYLAGQPGADYQTYAAPLVQLLCEVGGYLMDERLIRQADHIADEHIAAAREKWGGGR